MSKIYTPKQIEKYKRQKYLSALNKCTKNLYNIFKNPSSDYNKFKNRFIELKREIDKFNDVIICTDYIKKTKEYIDNLYQNYVVKQELTNKEFNTLKNREISNLNRLQKMKNQTKYSKNKYKHLDL